MNLRTRFGFLSALIIVLFALAACGGGGASTEHTIASDPTTFEFEQTEVTVPVGEQVTVTFENTSNLQHNWVLVRGGEDVAEMVNTEGNAVGEPNFLPEDQSNIIAATAMLDGGASETVTFTIDEPGDYRFICTFPAHYPTMAGTLTAQ